MWITLLHRARPGLTGSEGLPGAGDGHTPGASWSQSSSDVSLVATSFNYRQRH